MRAKLFFIYENFIFNSVSFCYCRGSYGPPQMFFIYCVCVKRITLWNCLCSSPFSHFSANLIPNIKEFGAKKDFTDHQTAITIPFFISIKRKFFGSILFLNKSQRRGIPQRLLDKYSHLFICKSLKQTLRSGQKPVYTVKILISVQIAFAEVFFGQVFVFCRLINKSVLEWFLLICVNKIF